MIKKKPINLILVFVIAFVLSGCVSKPVLYPNEYYKQVGKEQADKDIETAMKDADSLGLNSKWKKDAVIEGKATVEGAAVGTGIGIFNGSIGLGAIAGAISGFLCGMVSWMFPSEPSPVYKDYVDRELDDKGYNVIGWN